MVRPAPSDKAPHGHQLQTDAQKARDPRLIAKMPDHELWMAAVRDPWGNIIELMNEVRKQPGRRARRHIARSSAVRATGRSGSAPPHMKKRSQTTLPSFTS